MGKKKKRLPAVQVIIQVKSAGYHPSEKLLEWQAGYSKARPEGILTSKDIQSYLPLEEGLSQHLYPYHTACAKLQDPKNEAEGLRFHHSNSQLKPQYWFTQAWDVNTHKKSHNLNN